MHPSAMRYTHSLTRVHTRARERAHTHTHVYINTQARANPALARVTLIARGAALNRLRAHGLEYNVRGGAGEGVPQRIVVEKEMMRAEPNCSALRERGDLADYVILCVKTWQVPLVRCIMCAYLQIYCVHMYVHICMNCMQTHKSICKVCTCARDVCGSVGVR